MTETPLKKLAEQRGLLIGAACSPKTIRNEPLYAQTLAREFNCIVAENCMKFMYLEPERGRFTFEEADQLVTFAQQHNMRLRGHTLVWHNQIPQWLREGDFSKTEALDILRTHIFNVVDHYKGRVFAWDVVNEGLDDEGEARRNSRWFELTGEEYLPLAFKWAREADPDAKLFYNDYEMERPGPKADGCHAMLHRMLDADIPVDGVGFQYHLGVENRLDHDPCVENLSRFGNLGLDIHFTEVDMGIPKPVTDELRREQAREYANRVGIALDSAVVSALMFWGFTDRHSWVPGFTNGKYDEALLFDRSYQPKPALEAIKQRLATN